MSSLKRSAIWLTLLAIVLKLAGFLRESIIARQFGANEYTDGYILAFSFITLMLAMISGGFNNVFLPMYVKNKKQDPFIAEKNANGMMNVTVLFFLAITACGYFFVPSIVPFIFRNMTPTTEQVAIEITQLFFLFMSAVALNGILDSYLQSRRVFVPSQISKLLSTLTGAIFALFFSDLWGIHSVAYGFVVGILLGICVQLYFLLKSGYQWEPTVRVEKGFRKTFLILLVPALLNSVVGQINLFVNRAFATNTIEGAVTFLNNASLIVSIPHTIYGTTIAVIIFTLLSEQVNNKRKFQNTFFMGMELSFITLFPVAVGLFLVGDLAISFIYERGMFTADKTYHTYRALLFYLPMIITQGLQYIVSKSMYAKGKTAIIMRISVTTIVLNIILNYLLVNRFGYPGLALSSSFVSVYYLTVSLFFVYKDFDKGEMRKLLKMIALVIPPTILMGVPVFLLKKLPLIQNLYSLFQLMILVPVGVIVYIVGTYYLNRPGYNRLIKLVRTKENE